MRVIREEWGGNKRSLAQSRALAARKAAEVQAQAARAAQLQAEAANATKNAANGDGDVEMKEVKTEANTAATTAANTLANSATQNGSVPPPSANMPAAPRVPLDMVDEIINMLKTAFPLLALMMEKMVDHISIRAKPNSEEDIYRFFAALLNDAMQVSHLGVIVSSGSC
jgi:transformation/transcription domain-associated protein